MLRLLILLVLQIAATTPYWRKTNNNGSFLENFSQHEFTKTQQRSAPSRKRETVFHYAHKIAFKKPRFRENFAKMLFVSHKKGNNRIRLRRNPFGVFTSSPDRNPQPLKSTRTPATTTSQNTIPVFGKINITCRVDHLSCEGRCSQDIDLGLTNSSYLSCFCDEYCNIFLDCCYDYQQHCKNNSGFYHPKNWTLFDDIRSNIAHTSLADKFKCFFLEPLKKNLPEGADGIWMIAKCPDHLRNTTTQEKCAKKAPLSYNNYDDVLPVVASDGKTYKNRFCSRCHGVAADAISYYDLDFSCDVLPPQHYNRKNKLRFLFSYCDEISLKPKPGHQRRYCYDGAILKGCNISSVPEAIWRRCLNGSPAIVSRQNSPDGQIWNYKNIYCAWCLGISYNFSCGPTTETALRALGHQPDFSIIMNFGFSDRPNKATTAFRTKVVCPINKVYDPYLEICRTGFKNLPLPIETGFNTYTFSVWVKEVNKSTRSCTSFSRSKPAEDESVLNTLTSQLNTSYLSISNIHLTKTNKILHLLFDIKFKVKTNKVPRVSIGHVNLLNFCQPIDLSFECSKIAIVKVTSRRLTCVFVESFSPAEYTVITHPDAAIYINNTKELVKQHDYYRNEATGDSVFVCRQFLGLYCKNRTTVVLQRHEVELLTNRSILWKATGKIYMEGNYEKSSNKFWICTNLSSNGTKETQIETVDIALIVLSYVGLIASIVFTSALFITYCVFVELRTIPGINLMNLSFALIWSDLLLLVGSRQISNPKLCSAIALALHFGRLSCFVWMTVIGADTWRAFTRKGQCVNRLTTKGKRKSCIRNMMIGWFVPLGFCIACFTLDQTNGVAIGYGDKKVCWIQINTSILYFFLTPLILLLASNVVFFVLTVKSIREAIKKSKFATARKIRKNDLAIFARISTLVGFSWIVGILGSVEWNLYVQYVLFAICTTQGVYIAFAFLFTKRVLRLYKEWLFSGSKHRFPSLPENKLSSSNLPPPKRKSFGLCK